MVPVSMASCCVGMSIPKTRLSIFVRHVSRGSTVAPLPSTPVSAPVEAPQLPLSLLSSHAIMDGPTLDVLRDRMKSVPSIMGSTKGRRKAAVMVPLCLVNGVLSLLYMIRSKELRNHSGEVSFPGGMQDPTDANLLHTALRETEEEIFVPPGEIEVLGPHPSFPNHLNTVEITPFLGYFGEVDITKMKFNTSEVTQLFTLSLAQLHDPANKSWITRPNATYKIPVYRGGPQEVWGITAFITQSMLKHVLR